MCVNMSYVINKQSFRYRDTLNDDFVSYRTDEVEVSTPDTFLHSFNKLVKQFDKCSIQRMIINRDIILVPCGKCDECLTLKKINYSKRVKSQLNQYKFSYLITLTFNDRLLPVMLSEHTKHSILDYNSSQSMSSFSTLSKIHISNIIKNWKNKLNRYYDTKVGFHYFLCGEYGENTQRAHYHIMLMLDRPLPNLTRELVRGNHYKSSLIDSKQYSMYDIQPCDNKVSCSSYISKYLTKSRDSQLTRYNVFQEQQLIWYKEFDEHNLYNYKLFKSKEQLIRFLCYWYLDIPEYRSFLLDLYCRTNQLDPITKMREFVKTSRKLGITDDYFYNIKNGVLNSYYFKKMLFSFECLKYFVLRFYFIDTRIYLHELLFRMFIYVLKYYLLLFEIVERQRTNNIISTFNKHVKVTRYKVRNDIM